jgi:hypothetical protein
MFERFTDRARRVVVLAQEEARMLNHNYIGTEHLLLGLVHEGDGIAAMSLESLGISLGAVRSQVEEIIGRGQSAPTGHIPFTPRAKKVLELSLREALQLGHNYIGTEHILLGVIREGEGVGAQVLQKLGADLHSVRMQVIAILQGHEAKGGEPKPGRARSGSGLVGERSESEFFEELRNVFGADPMPPDQEVLLWASLLMEVGSRGRRARQVAERLASALGEEDVHWLDVFVGLVANEKRLRTLERLGRRDLDSIGRTIARLRQAERDDESEESGKSEPEAGGEPTS